MPEYPLPHAATAGGRCRLRQLDHPGLAYYRFVPLGLENEEKAGFLTALSERFAEGGAQPWRQACRDQAARLGAIAAAFESQGQPTATFERTTATRLLVGMGYKNALEVGLTFHHPGGFPYLPGSSVKGLCRAWAETVEEAPPETLLRVFGSHTKQPDELRGAMQAGSVCFLDALPTAFPALDVDLLNPHVGPYYQDPVPPPGEDPPGLTAPADWLGPVPVPFLAVAAGTPFRFVLVGRAHDTSQARRDVDLAAAWLQAALVDLGAGGKTAAGYGYFHPDTPTTPISPLRAPSASETASGPQRPAAPDAPSTGPFDGPPAVLRPGIKKVAARVVEVRDRKAWVELHAEGADALVKMEGRYNADGLLGATVLVEVWKEEWDKKAKRPRQVRFQRNLGS